MKSLEILAEGEENDRLRLVCTRDKQLRHLKQIKDYDEVSKEGLRPISTVVIIGESLYVQWRPNELVITDAVIPEKANSFITGKAKYGYRQRNYSGSLQVDLIQQCYVPVTFFG